MIVVARYNHRMCGRYKLDLDWTEIVRLYRLDDGDPLEFFPRYNVAPTQRMPVIVAPDGHRVARWMHWGLLSPWSKWSEAGRTINARAETVAESRTWRGPFRDRRALVPATGFYEWRREGDRKVPQLLLPRAGHMGMAGLWQAWRDPKDGAWIETFAVITCAAGPAVAPIHDRMPVILPEAAWDRWLDPDANPERLHELLVPAPDDTLAVVEVSPLVNNVRNESPECARPV